MFIFNYFTDMLFVLDKSDMFWIKVDHCPADGLCTNLLRDMLMGFCTYHLHWIIIFENWVFDELVPKCVIEREGYKQQDINVYGEMYPHPHIMLVNVYFANTNGKPWFALISLDYLWRKTV